MVQEQKRPPIIRAVALATPILLTALAAASCTELMEPGPADQTLQPAQATGLQIPQHLPKPVSRSMPRHRLVCTVLGTGLVPQGLAPQEAKLAGIEAALVEAIYRIVRDRPDDFQLLVGDWDAPECTVAVGENLTLHCRNADQGPSQLELVLDDRGRITRLQVADRQLTHPPHEPGAILKLLGQTHGKVKLLCTGWSDQPDHYYVQLGYYEPQLSSAGSVTRDTRGPEAHASPNPPQASSANPATPSG